MKKVMLILVIVFAFFSSVQAQSFSIGAALNVSAGSGIGTDIEASVLFGITDLARVGPLGVDARLEANLAINGAGLGFSVGAAALATFAVDIVTIYAGPQLVFVLAPSVPDPVRIGAIVGGRYQIATGVSAFAELNLLFTNPIFWRIRVGATLAI